MPNPISSNWPEYYLGVKDFMELAVTEEAELQLASFAIEQLFNDQFVLTSGADALKRRETMLGIKADPAIESFDFRRKRIVNRYSTKPPFTILYLQERLDYLVGAGKTLVTRDVAAHTLRVATALENSALFKEVEYTVRTILPANMIYEQQTSVYDQIGLQEHIVMRKFDRRTRLNTTWRLGAAAFANLEPEVVIK
ncbi:putative phage tail protein [Paenibacillus nasutitermitis]|uniref:Phage portal protein n=1 Tax=Paenibacillus nasutitermitis TaxID=1652958 RepID=A0A917E2Y8_9BACL|nr:putative phage tail protein [Paenibacillus nasutitermitis]GGD95211.1 phage portal protein [Paenibacillus nasutitermitis]